MELPLACSYEHIEIIITLRSANDIISLLKFFRFREFIIYIYIVYVYTAFRGEVCERKVERVSDVKVKKIVMPSA